MLFSNLRRTTSMKHYPLLLPFSLLFVGNDLAFAYSSGPPIGKAGEPGGSNCTDCHAGVVNSGPGVLSVIAPLEYETGATYEIVVSLEEDGGARWGFELVVFDSTDEPVGEITVSDALNTQLDGDYLMHTTAGTRAGTLDGPVDWSFDWTAPATDVGPISIYVAGNAANNNGDNTGDHIYTEVFGLDYMVGVQAMSWSALKRAR